MKGQAITRNAEQLEKELLKLTQNGRALLAHRLIVSIDEEEEHISETEWEVLCMEDVQQREREIVK